MASENLGANELREKRRWGDDTKVYTRRNRNKRPKNSTFAAADDAAATGTDAWNNRNGEKNRPEQSLQALDTGNGNSLEQAEQDQILSGLNASSGDKNEERNGPQHSFQALETENENSLEHLEQDQNLSGLNVVSTDKHQERSSPQQSLQALDVENGNSLEQAQQDQNLSGLNAILGDKNEERSSPQQSLRALDAENENGNSLQHPEQDQNLMSLNGVSDDRLQEVAVEVENGDSVIKAAFTATCNYTEKNFQQSLEGLATENGDSSQQPVQDQDLLLLNAVSDDYSDNQLQEVAVELDNGDGVIKPVVARLDNWVRITLAGANSKGKTREAKRNLVCELDRIRSLAKQIQDKEVQGRAAAFSQSQSRSQSQHSGNDMMDGRALVRVNSEVGTMGHLESRPFHPVSIPVMQNNNFGNRRALMRVNSEVGSGGGGQNYRPFRNLSVSVMENNNHIPGVGEFIEKEKRTPKANQFYRNSDFLLAKDRLPPESNKRAKPNSGRKHGREMEYGFGINRYMNQVFKNCSNLLQRLMKHKHGWVFNEPVNAKMLGLHDYHDIIKHPMDLGTIKSRLAQNFYKSPRDFAADVRLTFHNAMTYNPKGQDVHVMAEQLSDIFEEKWAVIEAEYNAEWRYEMAHYSGLPTPTSRKVPPPRPPPLLVSPMGILDRSESMTMPFDSRPKNSAFPVSRTPVPKKPKARDPNKRDMTFEEKQRLSTHLQSLPSEKLDNIVQIIKKRNSSVRQHDDEIEVDIDGVDAETLWELDRFVTNYKKSLSKNRKRAEIARARAEAGLTIQASNPVPVPTVAPKESNTDQMNVATAAPVQAEKQTDNVSRSSSSSSSSSDSGSSSSDSDSDSSSAFGSDAGHSPRTGMD